MEIKCTRCTFVGDITFFTSKYNKRTKLCSRCRDTAKRHKIKTGKFKGTGPANITRHFFVEGTECKDCIRCNTRLDLSCFSKDKRKTDGLYAICKLCCKREYESLSNEDKKARIEQIKKYSMKNRDKITERTRIWRNNNKDKLNEKVRNRINSTPQRRLARNLRSRLTTVIKHQNGTKSDIFVNLTGCSPDELKIHIENQFEEGMDWSNYSKKTWHVDHIRPIDSFDLTDPVEQQKCFHYSNLQPMWAKENLEKSNKWDPEDDIYEREICFWRDGEEIEISWLSP